MADHPHDFDPVNNICRVCRYERVAGESVLSFGGGRSAEDNRKLSDAILTDPKRGTKTGTGK